MNLTTNKIAGLAVVLGALALITVGCQTTQRTRPVAWTVSLTKVTSASIEVDLVGVNPTEKPYWQNVKPDDYWKPNSSERNGVKERMVTTNFQAGQTWVVDRNDPKWKEWFSYGTSELMIMANLPGAFDNGPFDRRRVFLPLDKKAWQAKDKTIEIQVQEGFIRVLTPPRR